jgi:hypothetical protein
MKKQVEELRRKSDLTSQQLQGEVQELEALLKAAFPGDVVEEVGKGRAGGDVVQKVIGPNGLESGVILWESKRTRRLGRRLADKEPCRSTHGWWVVNKIWTSCEQNQRGRS